MASNRLKRSMLALGISLVLTGAGHAQDRRLVPQGWSVGHVIVEGTAKRRGPRISRAEQSGEHELTVRRRFAPIPDDEDDPLYDGATHYNDVRLFDPVPSVDSGTQFPYGLDGVGGYGSDLGFAAAQDYRVYDRGQ